MRIGIDVGGTKIGVGLFGDNGELVEIRKASCPSSSGKQEVVDFIAAMVAGLFSEKVTSIGLGVPAVVDDSGVIHNCVNIPSWDLVDIKSDFEGRFGVPVTVRNDCNCYALGVKASAQGREYDNIVCITLGTGVGSGIIINGNLYSGVDSGAGEIGEIPFKDRNYEFYSGSQFFKHHGTTGKDASIAAHNGDPDALALWDEFGANVGALLSMVCFAYSPQAIFLGGSLSEAYPFFERSMMEKLSDFPYKSIIAKLKIHPVAVPGMILAGAAE